MNGALSSRTHFSGVPHRVTSRRPPAGSTISRRPSQNTSASWPSPSISIAIAASGLVTIGRANDLRGQPLTPDVTPAPVTPDDLRALAHGHDLPLDAALK